MSLIIDAAYQFRRSDATNTLQHTHIIFSLTSVVVGQRFANALLNW